MFRRSGPVEPPQIRKALEPDLAPLRGGPFLFLSIVDREDPMANHLTPEELAKETGIDREEVIRICIEEGVPIYHGKIDKTLFQASLEAVTSAGSSTRQ
jgi:hypothetical protein